MMGRFPMNMEVRAYSSLILRSVKVEIRYLKEVSMLSDLVWLSSL